MQNRRHSRGTHKSSKLSSLMYYCCCLRYLPSSYSCEERIVHMLRTTHISRTLIRVSVRCPDHGDHNTPEICWIRRPRLSTPSLKAIHSLILHCMHKLFLLHTLLKLTLNDTTPICAVRHQPRSPPATLLNQSAMFLLE